MLTVLFATNTRQVLAFVQAPLHKVVGPQEEREGAEAQGNEKRETLPPEGPNHPVHGETREDASEGRHETVQADDRAGEPRVHALHGDELAEGEGDVEEEAQQEAQQEEGERRGGPQQRGKDNARQDGRRLADVRTGEVVGVRHIA